MTVKQLLLPAAVTAVVAIAACGGQRADEPSPSAAKPPSRVTAEVTPSPTQWTCFDLALAEHGLCRLPDGELVLDSLGNIFATSRQAYPNCPTSWLPSDEGALCLPPSGWTYEQQTPEHADRVLSELGSEVLVTGEPFSVTAELCDPIYSFGLVLRPEPLRNGMVWCLHVGDRWTNVSVPADAPLDEYYTAFQVALSVAPSALR